MISLSRQREGGGEVADGENSIYLGVDVAGAKNTWVAGLAPSTGRLEVVHGPCKASLAAIVDYCEENDVVAVAIDAQLAVAVSDENGFRSSDTCLKEMLPKDCEHWVMSFNSLMAVPIRGRLLAEHLAPTVGTVIETHPRASLLFGLENDAQEHVRGYKSGEAEIRRSHTEELWRLWSRRFRITCYEPVREDGALDALVCATVAHRFHHEPSALHKLRHAEPGKVGRGPFYVLKRTSE